MATMEVGEMRREMEAMRIALDEVTRDRYKKRSRRMAEESQLREPERLWWPNEEKAMHDEEEYKTDDV